MDAQINLKINGTAKTVKTNPERMLLDVLREDLHLTGTKYGCGEGQCRACTVLMDGRPVTSCLVPLKRAENKDVVTIEGLAHGGTLHPVQEAFMPRGRNAMRLLCAGHDPDAVSLLEKNPDPSQEQIVEWMNGNLCRCCGYPKILSAVSRAAKMRATTKRE